MFTVLTWLTSNMQVETKIYPTGDVHIQISRVVHKGWNIEGREPASTLLGAMALRDAQHDRICETHKDKAL